MIDSGDVLHLAADGTELSRATGFGGGESVSVNSTDGSCWLADTRGGQVVHLAASGTELWRGEGFDWPESVSVNSIDGSCWVADTNGAAAAHLASGGAELWRARRFLTPVAMSVDSSDGSCWVIDLDHFDLTQNDCRNSDLVHLSADGVELWRGHGFDSPAMVSVSPTDGSCWVSLQGHWESTQHVGSAVVHLAQDGSELWRGEQFERPWSVCVNPTDGSCWVADVQGDVVVHLAADGSELWRGEGLDGPGWVSVNPRDGSCWVAFGHGDFSEDYRIARLAADGTELWRVPDLRGPLSVDPVDGSCWVADGNHMVRLSADGAQLLTVDPVSSQGPYTISANPGDGSCWAAEVYGTQILHLARDGSELWRGDDLLGPCGMAVNPSDGSCWISDTHKGQVARLMVAGWEAPTFPDVPLYFWAYEQVNACCDAAIVGGYPDGLYHPAYPVTRGQMAVFIARAIATPTGDAGVPEPAEATQSFTDVAADHWAYRYIECCSAEGVVQGYPGGAYHPDEVVNRGQMAVYVARAVAGGDDAVPEDTDGAAFADVTDGNDWAWCYDYVEYCAANAIVQGYADTTYRPGTEVTRDQMAVYVARAFELPM